MKFWPPRFWFETGKFENHGINASGNNSQVNVGKVEFNRFSRKQKPFFFNQYFVFARLLPASIGLSPLFVLIHLILNTELEFQAFEVSAWHLFFAWFLISCLMAGVFSNLSKGFENKYFKQGKLFPTTYFLLFGNKKFSRDLKERFRKKVNDQEKIKLPTEQEEQLDFENTISRFYEAMFSIRLRVKGGQLVLFNNIVYGAVRNLIPSSMAGLLTSLAGVTLAFLHLDGEGLPLLVLLALGYAAFLLVHKHILIKCAETYAVQLIHEYLFRKN